VAAVGIPDRDPQAVGAAWQGDASKCRTYGLKIFHCNYIKVSKEAPRTYLKLKIAHVRQTKDWGKLCLLGLDAASVTVSCRTLLFGLAWLRTRYGNGGPNAVTTVVDSVAWHCNSFHQHQS
jgi:hypothetical protein